MRPSLGLPPSKKSNSGLSAGSLATGEALRAADRQRLLQLALSPPVSDIEADLPASHPNPFVAAACSAIVQSSSCCDSPVVVPADAAVGEWINANTERPNCATSSQVVISRSRAEVRASDGDIAQVAVLTPAVNVVTAAEHQADANSGRNVHVISSSTPLELEALTWSERGEKRDGDDSSDSDGSTFSAGELDRFLSEALREIADSKVRNPARFFCALFPFLRVNRV